MATSQMSGFIQRLRRVLRDGAGLTDGQLLGDYLSRRDEAAIAALVRRHGPMAAANGPQPRCAPWKAPEDDSWCHARR